MVLPHPLTNFEIQKNCKNEPRFNGVYSRDNLPYKTRENLGGYSDIGTHWIALYSNCNTKTYFDSFGVKHIPKEITEYRYMIQYCVDIFFVLDLLISCLGIKA